MLKQDPKKKEQDISEIQTYPGASNIGRSLTLEGEITGRGLNR